MKYLALILIVIITSCNTDVKDHHGDWLISFEGEINSVIALSSDSIIIRRAFINNCGDTVIGRVESADSLYTPTITKNGNLVRITHERSLSGYSLEMKFETINKGILYQNRTDTVQCEFERTSLITRKTNKDFKKIRTARTLLAENILQTQEIIDNLLEKTEPAISGKIVLTYIDSLKQMILNEVNIDYSNENCWASHDSILSHYSPTQFLIGSEPTTPKLSHFSAVALRELLENYLNEIDNNTALNVAFPSFNSGKFEGHLHGVIMEPWELHKFYYSPLGKVIETLNRIKIGVIQTELIKNETGTNMRL